MKTRLLMTSSALLLGALGLPLTFLSEELLHALAVQPTPMLVVMVQLLGALYLAFAMVNWTAKESIIGGIYNRPVAIGNYTHFIVGTFTLGRVAFGNLGDLPLLGLTLFYAVYAIWFGLVFFGKGQAPSA